MFPSSSVADPDPDFKFDANPDPTFTLIRIQILPLTFPPDIDHAPK